MSDRPDLTSIVDAVRSSPGWRSKAHIGVVGDVFGEAFGKPDWREGPGDDGAVVRSCGESYVVCGEAILPAFFERDPFGAGVAGALAPVGGAEHVPEDVPDHSDVAFRPPTRTRAHRLDDRLQVRAIIPALEMAVRIHG